MAAFQKFDSFVEHLAEKVHDLANDSLKFLLTNTAPDASDSVKSDITEISAGNGYSAGGVAVTVASSGQSGGTYKLVLNDPTPITASGGSVGPFRYAVLYNDTPTSPADPLIAFFDYGSSITLAAGEVFNFDCDPTTGVLTAA